jgi:hypothetical protein
MGPCHAGQRASFERIVPIALQGTLQFSGSSIVLYIPRGCAQMKCESISRRRRFSQRREPEYETVKTTPTYAIAADDIPHSHSILSTHRNALIYQRNFFLLTVKARPSSRQNFPLLISNRKSRDSNFVWLRQLSPTIGQFSRCRPRSAFSTGMKKDRQHL